MNDDFDQEMKKIEDELRKAEFQKKVDAAIKEREDRILRNAMKKR